jgi:hypothetical protein
MDGHPPHPFSKWRAQKVLTCCSPAWACSAEGSGAAGGAGPPGQPPNQVCSLQVSCVLHCWASLLGNSPLPLHPCPYLPLQSQRQAQSGLGALQNHRQWNSIATRPGMAHVLCQQICQQTRQFRGWPDQCHAPSGTTDYKRKLFHLVLCNIMMIIPSLHMKKLKIKDKSQPRVDYKGTTCLCLVSATRSTQESTQ